MPDLAEGDGVQRPVMVAELHGADGDGLDRPGHVADVDVLPLAEGVVDEEEHPGDDVPDKGLGAEADRHADDAGPGQQGRHVDADLAEHGQRRENDDDHLAGAAHERHDRAEAGAPLPALALRLLLAAAVDAEGRPLDRDLPVGHDPEQLPAAVGDDADQEDLQQGAGELRADPLRGQIAEVEPPGPREDEDEEHAGDGPPAAHEPELGLRVGGAQGRLLVRVVGPDRVDEGPDHQLEQGQGQQHREREVERRDREALDVAGRVEELDDQPLERDEPDRDHRPDRREAVPGRAAVAVSAHHPGDAGAGLPDRERHQAVVDQRDPEAEAAEGVGPAEGQDPLEQAGRERRPSEDETDPAGEEPRGPVVDGAKPQVRAGRREHEARGHHREPGPADRADQVADHRAVRGNRTVDDGIDDEGGDHEGEQPHPLGARSAR